MVYEILQKLSSINKEVACNWFLPQTRINNFFNVAKFASIWQNMDQGTFLPQTGEYWLTTTTATSNSAEFLQRLTCFATRRAFCDLAIFATLVETGVMTTEICSYPGTLLYFKTQLIWISALTYPMKPSIWAIKIKNTSDFILPLSYIHMLNMFLQRFFRKTLPCNFECKHNVLLTNCLRLKINIQLERFPFRGFSQDVGCNNSTLARIPK